MKHIEQILLNITNISATILEILKVMSIASVALLLNNGVKNDFDPNPLPPWGIFYSGPK